MLARLAGEDKAVNGNGGKKRKEVKEPLLAGSAIEEAEEEAGTLRMPANPPSPVITRGEGVSG